MKIRPIAALPAALLLLLPRRALAMAEDASFAFHGAERIAAYWVLGVCSAVFVLLVCIWSIMLKRSAQNQSAPAPVRARRKP